jgi:phospholipid/cholesterol/gamma-HCH transport system substrate-binding protein
MARSRKNDKQVARSNVIVGLALIAVVVFLVFEVFTGFNPISKPYKVSAVFQTSDSLRNGSPVRIAGIEIGKVTKVTAASSSGGSKVEMTLMKNGLPLHQDATMKIRPRIFLEGNFFIDVKPGSPSSPTLKSGSTIPLTQTATPVQLGDVLTALDSDTRTDLKVLLREYGGALKNGGAKGINDSIPYWKPAYRDTSLVNEAFLGSEPDHDIRDVLRGQSEVALALTRDDNALKGLVTNFNTTAAALAGSNHQLSATIPALRDTLRVSRPALLQLDRVLPTLRVFAREALPGVRSSGPALAAATPFVRQLRLLSAPSELQGAARSLRKYTPSLVQVTQRSIPLLTQTRALSACTAKVLVPFINSPIPDPDFPANTGQTVNEELQRGFVGLAGESRNTDANGSYFNTEVTAPPLQVRPAPPLDGGAQPPVHRPDVPCETQDPPNLEAPGASALQVLAPGTSSFTARRDLPSSTPTDRSRAFAMLRRALPTIRRDFDAFRATATTTGASGPTGASGDAGSATP